MPVVVGMRARTTHVTSGRTSRSFGFLEPQPPEAVLLSTGTERASLRCGGRGVWAPGVEGGVNAGETRPGK